MSSISCPKCGAPADSQGAFCGNCGYAFKGDGAATSSPAQGQQSGGFASPFPAPGSLSTPSSPTYSTNSMHPSSAYQGAGFPPPPPPPSYRAGNTPSSSLYPSAATPPPPPLSSPSYPANGAQFSQAAPPKIEPNMPPPQKRMGKKSQLIIILSVVVIIILAGTVGIFAFMSHNQATSTSSSTPTTGSTSQPTSNTASPTQSVASPTSDTSSATPGATATLTVQPSAPVISGVAVKNLTLPCTACAADPVHVIINSIQVDTANGRMIWDTTLKDVTNSNSGFSVNQFSLLASGSTTQVDAVLSQSQFSGNQANMQAIFALLPAQGEIYTLTVVVNWYQNSSNNLSFDPIQFSFAADGTPTAVLPQPTPTVKAGSITKNLTLTCSQCASDPVHVTINTIQIDTANGRMIWDTTLKDVTNSNSGFSVNQYSIEASATAKVDAVLPQTQFSGNSADVQAIFAFVPSPGVTYTFTVVVNWYQNSSNNLAFDPVQITF